MANTTIKVTPVRDARAGFDSQVIMLEFDHRHPNGQALVYRKRDRVFDVGDTALVRRHIEAGRLRRVTADDAPQTQTAPEDTGTIDDDLADIPDADILNEWPISNLRALATKVGVDDPDQYKGNGAKDELVAAILEQSDRNGEGGE